MRRRIMDGKSHSVFWGIVEIVYIATAIFVGVEFGWKAGVICFLAPICVYLGGFLISAAFWLAVNLFVYGVVEGFTRTGGWFHQTLRNIKERRKRRKQSQAICRRCGLRTSALTPDEALAFSEEDIQTISWAAYKSNQATAERIAHVLADPAARQLAPDAFTNLQGEAMKDIRALRTRLLVAAAYHIRGEGWDTITDLPCMDWLCNSIYGVDLSDSDCVDILDAYSRFGADAADQMTKERSIQNAIAHDFMV